MPQQIAARKKIRRKTTRFWSDKVLISGLRAKVRKSVVVVEARIDGRWREVIDTQVITPHRFCFEITPAAIKQKSRAAKLEKERP